MPEFLLESRGKEAGTLKKAVPGSGATLKALIVLRSSLFCFWLQGEPYPSSSSRNQLRIMGTRPVEGKKPS